MEIQVEQRAQPERRDHRADTDLPAEQESDEDGNDLGRGAAQADRAAGLMRERNHERVARPRAKRALHIHPGTERKQLHPAQQHQDAGQQALHLRDPVQPEQAVDACHAQDNVNHRADAEALAAQHRRTDRSRAHNHGGRAIGDAGGLRQSLLQHAPRFQTDIRLQHHRDPERTDRHTGHQPEQAVDILTHHGVFPLLSNPPRKRRPVC